MTAPTERPTFTAIEVSLGSAHTFADRGDDSVRFIAEHRPALRFEQFLRGVHALVTSPVAKGQRSPTTLLRVIRLENGYRDVILPPPGFPRLTVGVFDRLGGLLGYPSG